MTFLIPSRYSQSASIALIESSTSKTVSYQQLNRMIANITETLKKLSNHHVVLLRATPSIDFVSFELGALAAGSVVILHNLLDPKDLTRLANSFKVSIIAGEPKPLQDGEADYLNEHFLLERTNVNHQSSIQPIPQLLLGTSGSTGSPKHVRLSTEAVVANAQSISEALGILENDNAITSLPLSYSYGLSVLHSHLRAGATVTLSDLSVTDRNFWNQMREFKCTSFAGVPFTYNALHQMRFHPKTVPDLRVMTQAGGKLNEKLVIHFRDLMMESGGEFRVMYGQTEATARMAIASMTDLMESPHTVGRAIPRGSFSIDPELGATTGTTTLGRVIYHGPNVMLGYAEDFNDLQKPDEMQGVLDTGDLGYLDQSGRLFIEGRLKRIAKIFGVRVSLDDLDRLLNEEFPHCSDKVCLGVGDRLIVVTSCSSTACDSKSIQLLISEYLDVNRRGIDVVSVTQLPLLQNGKIDYRRLQNQIEDEVL